MSEENKEKELEENNEVDSPSEDAVEDAVSVDSESSAQIGSGIQAPKLHHNYISFIGFVISAATLVSITLLFLLEITGSIENPYLAIFTYILLPGVMMFGIAVVIVGMLRERVRRRKMSPEEIAAFPILDLNNPRRRRAMVAFLLGSFIFLFASAFGSYQAFEYSESVEFCGEVCHTVMKPEAVAHKAAPHAKVRCVDCHVGAGAEGYIQAKLGGVRQMYVVMRGTWDTPIKTPVHNMTKGNETCAKCHWPEKYYGEKLRVFNHYGYDENNSLNQTRMLIKVGGGNPDTGAATGIHWHMNLSNEITYISSDDRRMVIPWVRMKDAKGNVTEFFKKGTNVTQQLIAKSEKRTMDCIDCHNRPTHVYLSPNEAVDLSLAGGKLDVNLPFMKAKAVEVLSGQYKTNDEAVAAIAKNIDAYYRTSYPAIYSSRRASVEGAAKELQRIYQTYFFPEMNTDWRAHPNNIGHLTVQGCFRCHSGDLVSSQGKVISNDCTICHTTLDQTYGGKTFAPQDGVFRHPVNLGNIGPQNCAACHKGDRTFQHPVRLGDISKFNCADCHKGDNYKVNW